MFLLASCMIMWKGILKGIRDSPKLSQSNGKPLLLHGDFVETDGMPPCPKQSKLTRKIVDCF